MIRKVAIRDERSRQLFREQLFTQRACSATLSHAMTALKVIFRGRCERTEFVIPHRQCVEMLERIGVSYCVNPAKNSQPVDFILFFQSYPYEFSPADLRQLRRENPFAPFFFVLGVCCEGMLRTAGSLDSPFYCYVHGWSGNEPNQICRFLTDEQSLFSLPLTAENDEIAQWQTANGRRQTANGRRQTANGSRKCLILTHIGPFGNDSAMNCLLADEYLRLGYEPYFSGKTLPETFSGNIIADADGSPKAEILESIQRLRQQFADNDFTVYVDSPRIDEKNSYIRAGATNVLTKIRG